MKLISRNEKPDFANDFFLMSPFPLNGGNREQERERKREREKERKREREKGK